MRIFLFLLLSFFLSFFPSFKPDSDGPFSVAPCLVYQGLIPWAWIEASTKGAVLLFAAAEIETAAMGAGLGSASAGLLGGMGGGVAQAYATVGFCTCMKTAEITRSKMAVGGVEPPST